MPRFGCGMPVAPRFALGLFLCSLHAATLAWTGALAQPEMPCDRGAPPYGDGSGGDDVGLPQQVRATRRRTPPVMVTSARLKTPVRTGPMARWIKSTTHP